MIEPSKATLPAETVKHEGESGETRPPDRKENNMYIGNNFMVCGTFYNHLPHNEYFIDEKSAREYANRLYSSETTKSVELLKRQRNGYVKVKKIVRHHEGAMLWLEK